MVRTFRVGNVTTQQGLWYDRDGKFTGYIHDKLNFCSNKDLEMPYDEAIKGYMSCTLTLEDLKLWFTPEDIAKLKEHDYYIMEYEATDYKEHANHYVMKDDSKLVRVYDNGYPTQKEILQYKFDELMPNHRLLAIQLDGFSHKAYYDSGTADSTIQVLRYSGCTPEQVDEHFNQPNAIKLLCSEPHYIYQNQPIEIIYVDIKER